MAFKNRVSDYPNRKVISVVREDHNSDGTIKKLIADVDYYDNRPHIKGTELSAESLSNEVINTVLEKLYGITSITKEVVVSSTEMEKIEITYDKTMDLYVKVIALGGYVSIGNIDYGTGKISINFDVIPYESGRDSSLIIPKAVRILVYSDEYLNNLLFKYDVDLIYVYTGQNID